MQVDATGGRGVRPAESRTRWRKNRIRAYYLRRRAGTLRRPSAKNLAGHGLVNEKARIIVERPIGRSLASARVLNDEIGAVFTEETDPSASTIILAKETVQNLMALRFANALYEPRSGTPPISDHVQITVAETVGLEGRAGYYEKAGALRDMVQNHILQLLCLVAMEAPFSLDADGVRDEKLKVLKALKPIENGQAGKWTVRGPV